MRAIATSAAVVAGVLLATGALSAVGCAQVLGLGDLQSDAGVPPARDASHDARTHDASLDHSAHDHSTPDAGKLDAAVPGDSGVGACGAGSSRQVFVDGDAAAGGDGGAMSPFRTITDAVQSVGPSPAHTVTISVAAGNYTEPSITLPPNVALVGAMNSGTMLYGEGCPDGTCPAILVEQGASLCWFNVTRAQGYTLPAAVAGPTVVVPDIGVPVVSYVTVSGMQGDGIVANTYMAVGPGVRSSENGFNGLVAGGGSDPSVVEVVPGGGVTNHFDSNGLDGIYVKGQTTLIFGGGTATNNGTNGIELGGCNTSHIIANLVASENHTGVRVSSCVAYSPLGLTLRASALEGNVEGLYYDYGAERQSPDAGDPLDIGTPDASGANTFALPGSAPEAGTGVFLCNARGPMTQQASGDMFATPTCLSALEPSCSQVPTSYVDVAYTLRGTGAGASPIVCP